MFKSDNQLDDFFGLTPEAPEPKPKEGIRDTILKKLSWGDKFRLAPKVLTRVERYVVFGFFIIILGSLISIPFLAYQHYTVEQPAYGGSLSEGVLGEPRHINPLLAQSDADRDLVTLVYSSLMRYNADGKLVPDLAKSYEISPDGLTYTVYLKDNALWHDGQRVTADDVIYTIQTAQNTDYASTWQINWAGVDLERVDDYTVMFKLKNKYAQFLNSFTLGILPKHLWQDVKPINFSLFEGNLNPVGSGPYRVDNLQKDAKFGTILSVNLGSNRSYYNGRPYIGKLQIKFYHSEDELIEAYNRNEVENIGAVSAQNLKKVKFQARLNLNKLKLPRYFAVFFNQNQSKVLSEKNVRLAISHATDKNALIGKVLNGDAVAVNSPMIGGILDFPTDTRVYDYNPELARTILKESGWKQTASASLPTGQAGQGPAVLEKNKERLSVKITTSTWSEFIEVANILKEQWGAVGVDVQIEALPISQLQQVIKDRDYQSLLFGEILPIDPDPFTVWHSSQKRDPGLNLALYDNKAADTLLEEARQTLSPLERMKKYDDFQKLVIEDIPAIFLYSPHYLYGQTRKVNGFETKIISIPSDRFTETAKWYVETDRIWKQ